MEIDGIASHALQSYVFNKEKKKERLASDTHISVINRLLMLQQLPIHPKLPLRPHYLQLPQLLLPNHQKLQLQLLHLHHHHRHHHRRHVPVLPVDIPRRR
jgi:hypothetical protein